MQIMRVSCALLCALTIARCEDDSAISPSTDNTTETNGRDPRISGGYVVQNRADFNYQCPIRENIATSSDMETLSLDYSYSEQTNDRIQEDNKLQHTPAVAFVSLLLDDAPKCGASIIDHRNLLTSARCVTDLGDAIQPSRFTAVIGSLSVHGDEPQAERREILQIFVHERYNWINNMNDIAVLRIDVLTFNANIRSVPIQRSTQPAFTDCSVSGWGATSYGGIPSNRLRYAMVQTWPQTYCRYFLGSNVLHGMFCAGYTARDACKGDHGGPLVCHGFQVGIVSWGFGCGDQDYPGVYTSIPHFFTWIQMQQESSSPGNLDNYKYMLLFSIVSMYLAKIFM